MSFKKVVAAVVVGHFTYDFINGIFNGVGHKRKWMYRVSAFTARHTPEYKKGV